MVHQNQAIQNCNYPLCSAGLLAIPSAVLGVLKCSIVASIFLSILEISGHLSKCSQKAIDGWDFSSILRLNSRINRSLSRLDVLAMISKSSQRVREEREFEADSNPAQLQVQD